MPGMRKQMKPILVAAAAAMAVAGLGALMTDLGSWYQDLAQPRWKPPDWAFGPAWTLIFALSAAAGVVAWRDAPGHRSRGWLLVLFALNAFLNVFWSLLYFRLHRPDQTLVEVVFPRPPALPSTATTGTYSPSTRLLLVPYLLWISFAAALNWATVQLNGPF
jgi:translocator protein